MELLSTGFAPRPKELDPFPAVSWGSRVPLRIISGPTYHSIELITNILDPKDIERVELSLDGSQKYNVTAETLVALQAHRKNYAEAGRYVLSFGDATLRTKIGVRQSDLVTLQGEMWFLHVTLKSKPDGTPPPAMRARAHVLPSQSERYYMPRLYEMTWQAASTGRTPFDFSERGANFNIKRIHFKDDSIDRVRVLRDSYEELNVTKVDNEFDLAQSKKEQSQGWFSLDFIRFGFGADGMLNTAATSQLAFELDKNKVGAVPVIVEALEQVKALPVSG